MNAEKLLLKGMDELGLSCSKKATADLLTLLSELKKWNKAYNLTSLKTDEDIIIKHFLDSLLYLKVFPDNALKAADIGTGAGFPGIPIKIIRPDIEMTLVEPSRKKAAFLRNIVRVLKLDKVNVLQMRAEEMGEDLHDYFDIIVSRATFSIMDYIQAASPYIRPGGVLIVSKGPNYSEEIKEHPETGKLIKEVKEFVLPYGGGSRNLILLNPKQGND
ncbi:MAG: 16S rRNA (guanine(527)-N(7))-methyltransferase RsmG [Thermodesulfovibrionia bacterium]|nr:16S rRNA (guanine(527)-N(7))-methyltransferase RsmG [Thermodesulfovibrionia bacterium]